MFLAVRFAGEAEDLAEPLDVKIIARKNMALGVARTFVTRLRAVTNHAKSANATSEMITTNAAPISMMSDVRELPLSLTLPSFSTP